MDAALSELSTFDWVVFTSANGVKFAFERLSEAGKDARAFGSAKVVAIGPGTADALKSHGIHADFVPTEFVAEKVLAEFPESVSGKKILIPRAADARELLPETWITQGADVTVAPAYRSLPDASNSDEIRQQLSANTIDAITFASAATVTNFVEALGADAVPESVRLICIGPVTAQTCREKLREPDAVAETYTLDGLVAALLG